MGQIKVIAFDLDGTLTQHRTPLGDENKEILDRLGEKYSLLMVGAGMCSRIFKQMGEYPIDIIGNYGMQFCRYDRDSKELKTIYDEFVPFDAELVERRVTELRERFGFTEYKGANVEFHTSGCLTFPVLGTKADIQDKLVFDPDRKKRRPIWPAVKEAFPEYTVFVGGSSSFDMAPYPYNKYYALDRYCKDFGYTHDEIVYVGDDYGPGGNDESVFLSDFRFIKVDDYRELGTALAEFL